MREQLQKNEHFELSLIPSGGGVFEIMVGGTLVYSKKKTGRFPTNEEIEAIVKSH